jgi:predicted ATP-dependent endonuclease of OLD family
MILRNIDIKAFKSINELQATLNPQITVLIGANGSGKTNVLKSLESFRSDIPFDSSCTCQYSNNYYMGKCPEITLEFADIGKAHLKNLVKASELFKDVESFKIRRDGPELSDYHLILNDTVVENIDMSKVLNQLPKILYFCEIPLLKNKIDFDSLNSNRLEFLTEKNLLKIGGIEDYSLIFEDSSKGRRAIEEASRIITEQIRRVWSQEPTIEIKLHVNGNVLYIDFSDSTTVLDPPESRSLGFRWYLSFYVNFITQVYVGKSKGFIFLIDEPGIHLHPAGQKDLVKVLEDLAERNQVVFTTHSPFLINRKNPDRVLLIYKGKIGTRVNSKSYKDNWKPLRKQIGLTIGDMFFFNDNSLVIELPSNKTTGFLSKYHVDNDGED